MRIFDKDKTQALTEYDLSVGYLQADKILVAHHDAVEATEEQGHYETVKEYPNGGKDVKWVVDTDAVAAAEAYDEYEDVQIYIPYTAEELAERAKQTRLAEIVPRRDELSKDLIQAYAGLIIEDIEERRKEFRALHNEIRALTGLESREVDEIEEIGE